MKLEKRLKILVVEDNEKHIRSAEECLSEHDVTIVKTYDEAADLLTGGSSYSPVGRERKEKIFETSMNLLDQGYTNEEVSKKSRELEQRSIDEVRVQYDVVLTDMFIPQGRGDCLRDKSKATEEMPFGYAVMLMAAKEKTPYVAILTDGGHHDSGIVYSMDFFRSMTIEDSKCKFYRAAVIKSYQGAKNWKYVLDDLVE